MKYIGDKNTFAIRYVYDFVQNNDKYKFAYCHLVLGGQIIGDKNELCYLNSWKPKLEKIKELIQNSFESISHIEFQNRTDKELIELISKANQLEEEYNTDYNYLPILENKVWSNCHISMDETTDDFLIVMIEWNNKVKFLWKYNDENAKVYGVVVKQDYIIKVVEETLKIIEKDYYT